MREIIENTSYTFSNGVTITNVTPHPLSFMNPEGEKIIIPTSVKDGEKTGVLVVNATATTEEVSEHLVKTSFEGNEEGHRIIEAIKEVYPDGFIVGSLVAANAYVEVVGMIPEKGFERVPPADKLMSCNTFNVGEKY